jgi:hypothetical protein
MVYEVSSSNSTGSPQQNPGAASQMIQLDERDSASHAESAEPVHFGRRPLCLRNCRLRERRPKLTEGRLDDLVQQVEVRFQGRNSSMRYTG